MGNNNKKFKISRELYGDSTVTYNNIKLVALNRFDLGSSSSFNWGDTSTGSETLAYSILNKIGSKDIASNYAKPYMKDVISRIKKDDWTLEASSVIQWINENTNYSLDENAYSQDGTTTFVHEERRDEDRRKEERRVQREKDFKEESQRRLKAYEAKQQERRPDDRRQEDRRISPEQDFQEKAKKRIKEIHAEYQQEIENYKKQIIKKNSEIQAYQARLEKYKFFIESLDVKSMFANYCNLDK